MLRQRILTLTTALAAVALATATINDSVTLKRVVKVGDVHTWKLNVDMDFQGTEVNITADITEEVLKVNEDGSFTVTEMQENQVIIMAGAEQAGPEAPAVKSTVAASGQILKIESTQMDPDAYRFASLMIVMWPTKDVDVGSEWKVETKADSEKGTFDMTYEYEIVERGDLLGHDCFKIDFKTEETSGGSASSEGTIWIDVKTGLTVKVDGDMYSAPMMGMAIDAHFLVELDN